MRTTHTLCTYTHVNAYAYAIYLHIKQVARFSGALFQNLIIHWYSLQK